MKRTTIVLPDDLAALLEWERRQRGVSAAAIVREALDAHLARPAGPLPFVALGRSGDHDTAQRIEEILEREWTLDWLKGTDPATNEPPIEPDASLPPDAVPAPSRPDATERARRDGSDALVSGAGAAGAPEANGRGPLGDRRATPDSAEAAMATAPRRRNADHDGDGA